MKLSSFKLEHLTFILVCVVLGLLLFKPSQRYQYLNEDKVFDKQTGVIYNPKYKVDYINQTVKWYELEKK